MLQLMGDDFFLPGGLEVDYLVLSNNAIKNFDQLSGVSYKTLIIDSSYSTFLAKRIENEAMAAGVNVYSVINNGAFLATL